MKRLFTFMLIIVNFAVLHAQEKCHKPLCSPTFAEIYDYNVGDYFKYETHSNGYSAIYNFLTTITDSFSITGKWKVGDTLYYTRKGTSTNVHVQDNYSVYPDYIDITRQTSPIDDTLIYINSADNFLNKCPGTLLDVGNLIYPGWDLGYYTSVKITQNGCSLIKTVGGDLTDTNYFRVDSAGAITGIIIGNSLLRLGYVKKESYAKGLGLISEFFTQNGSDITSGNLIEYIKACNTKSLPQPEITNGDTVVVCPGTSVVLRANKSNACTYQWYLNDAPVAGATADTLVVTHFKESNGSGAGSYQVAESNGCNNKIISKPVQVVFRVKFYLPDHSNMSDTINPGEKITLMPYVQDFHHAPLTYSWDADPSLSATNIENPVASPVTSDVYKLTVSDGLCADSTLFNVIVRPPVIPECSPDFAEIYDFNVGDYFKYEEVFNSVSSSIIYKSVTTESYIITGKQAVNDTLYYTRSGTTNEVNERTYYYDNYRTKTVQKKSSPINDTLVYVNTPYHFLNKCPGTLIDDGKLIDPAYSFGYYAGIRTSQNECMQVKSFGSDNMLYRVDSTGAITDTITGYELNNLYRTEKSYAKGYGLINDSTWQGQENSYGSLIGYIRAPYRDSIAPAEITNGDTVEVCGDSKVVLRANKSNLVSYQWIKDGTPIPGATYDTLEVADSGQYRVVETDGCHIMVTSDITWVIVYRINVKPDIDGCNSSGDRQFYGITDYNGVRPITYSWEGDSTLIAIHNQFAMSNATTPHTYILIASNGVCEDSSAFNINPPKVKINTINESISCGDTVHLETTTKYTDFEPFYYHWTPSTGLNATDIPNPVVTIGAISDYSVEVTTESGCMASDSIHLVPSAANYTPAICLVTVDSNNYNDVIWQKANMEPVDSVYVYRELSTQNNDYQTVGVRPFTTDSIFIDSSSDAALHAYRYKIAARDNCGFLTDSSTAHKTMYLSVQNETGNTRILIWESYSGIAVEGYKVYRGTDRSNLVPVATLTDNDTTYTDNTATGDSEYYQIEAVTSAVCSDKKILSNIAFNNIPAVTGTSLTIFSRAFIYPNPAFDNLFIKNVHSSGAKIEILDTQGKQVINKLIDSGPLDISFLPKGIYIVKLIDSGNIRITKLVKE